jgi:hypothetical protein
MYQHTRLHIGSVYCQFCSQKQNFIRRKWTWGQWGVQNCKGLQLSGDAHGPVAPSVCSNCISTTAANHGLTARNRGDAVVTNVAPVGWLDVEQTDWLTGWLTHTNTHAHNLLTDENDASETSLIIHVCLEQNQGQRQICCSVWVSGGPPCTGVGPVICTKYTEYFD